MKWHLLPALRSGCVSLCRLDYLHKSFYALPHLIQVAFSFFGAQREPVHRVAPISLLMRSFLSGGLPLFAFFSRSIAHGLGKVEHDL
jgi:hypothetical protein